MDRGFVEVDCGNGEVELVPDWLEAKSLGYVQLPWNTLERVCKLSPSALKAFIVLCKLKALQKRNRLKFEYKWSRNLGLSRQGVYRALDELAIEGLLSIERKAGSCPVVTVTW